jgi:hypothetical protein
LPKGIAKEIFKYLDCSTPSLQRLESIFVLDPAGLKKTYDWKFPSTIEDIN